MNDTAVIGGCMLLTMLAAGFVGLLTGSYATVFAGTPVGFAVYLAVGIGNVLGAIVRAFRSGYRAGA
ncbi:hypothetical protein [Halopiger xanaduensis]|uniref:Uncharacterized protein n=1 Tax=Halopiger xanaduensis (strain DSM 18323 / JCM 14033 / SH-6) TaxID=797210 RepID=F8D7Q7_HALXS|nr:hypothetical protein [Halopiger xanaduensis]AEH35505.1 hypothetical protein Halxa_0866 [Halopiger xanaduensis SH-6]